MVDYGNYFVAPCYCPHGHVIDGYCEWCEWEDLQDERGEGFALFRSRCSTIREHVESADCWCYPTLQYADPHTGRNVWQHHKAN